jgi:hypothetical protein
MKKNSKRGVILEQIKNVSLKLGRIRFTRDEFYKNTDIPITAHDIENEFESFANAMVTADLKPAKWSKLSDEDLFMAYDGAYKKLGHYPLGHPGERELSKLTPIAGTTFRKRFGGLKNFLFEYKNWLLDKENQTQPKTISGKAHIVLPKKLSEKKEIAPIKTKTPEIEDGYIDNQRNYSGKGAENLVVAELLFRGFNAQLLQVDEGIDVFATNTKKNELYLIQVKYTYFKEGVTSRSIALTVSSFEKNKKANVYYIFVLEQENKGRSFLIIPFHLIDHLLKNGSITSPLESKKINLSITYKDEENVCIGSNDMSRYLNAWDVLL